MSDESQPPEDKRWGTIVYRVVEPLIKPIKDYFVDIKGRLDQHDNRFDGIRNDLQEILRKQSVMEEKIDSLRRELKEFRNDDESSIRECAR